MTDDLDKLKDAFGIIPASRLIGPYTYRARLFKCDNCGTDFFPRGHENWCIDCRRAERQAYSCAEEETQ